MSASKRTAERRAQALALARKGRFRSHVAATIGVHRSVLYDWLRDDDDFALAYAAAEAAGEEALLASALLGGDEGKASQWYLERWRQFRYGRRERHELTGKGGGAIATTVTARVVVLPELDADDEPGSALASDGTPAAVPGEPR
jgi:hypothetical protein